VSATPCRYSPEEKAEAFVELVDFDTYSTAELSELSGIIRSTTCRTLLHVRPDRQAPTGRSPAIPPDHQRCGRQPARASVVRSRIQAQPSCGAR
jgi:hypothetical protein